MGNRMATGWYPRRVGSKVGDAGLVPRQGRWDKLHSHQEAAVTNVARHHAGLVLMIR